jgi:hypothetical protein
MRELTPALRKMRQDLVVMRIGRRGEATRQGRNWSSLSRRGLGTAVVGAASVALLVWVAPPGRVFEQIGHMSLTWVMLAVVLELGSCLS